MIDWINTHGVVILTAGIIYNSAVQALPKPDNCGKFYIFLYGFMHALAANWGLVGKAKDKFEAPCDINQK